MSATLCRPDSAAFYPAKQAAPRTARHLLAKRTGKFSPENLRDKMPRRAFYPALQGRSKLRCENRLTPPLLPGSALRQAQGPHPTATRSTPFQSGLGFISSTPPVLISVVGKYRFSIIVIQKNVKKALEWRRETWQKSICAERTRQRSFKPRSESDTLYPRSAFFDAFSAGNGSAFVLTFTFANFH